MMKNFKHTYQTETKVIYNRLNSTEKKSFTKYVIEQLSNDSWKIKLITWYAFYVVCPFMIFVAPYRKRKWCDTHGFFCDDRERKIKKCKCFKGKDKVKKGWESFNNRAFINSL